MRFRIKGIVCDLVQVRDDLIKIGQKLASPVDLDSNLSSRYFLIQGIQDSCKLFGKWVFRHGG